jgi:hypothetical protein
MSEHERVHGAGEKGDAEGEIGVERLRLRRGFRKEHGAENQRGRGAENVEIVELDRRADKARQHDPADACAFRLVEYSLKRRHVLSFRAVDPFTGSNSGSRRVPQSALRAIAERRGALWNRQSA